MTRRPAEPTTPIGRALRALRVDAGLTGPQAAKAAGISQQALSRYEIGDRVPTPLTMRELCRAYKVGTERRRELVAMVRAAHDDGVDVSSIRQQNRWQQINDRIDAVEESAQVITAWKPAYIDGDCQTRAYATAMWNDEWDPATVASVVNTRMQRQQLLTSGRTFRIAHAEGALMWPMGGPAVMVEQMDHLLELSTLDNVQLGVVPYTALARAPALHGFTVFDRSSVHFGTGHRTEFISDHRHVQEYLRYWSDFEPLIVWGDEAREVFRRVRGLFAAL